MEGAQDILAFDGATHISGQQTSIIARYLNAAVDGAIVGTLVVSFLVRPFPFCNI